MADGFLGRWSRRKLDSRQGRPLADEPTPPTADAEACGEDGVTACAPEAPATDGQGPGAPPRSDRDVALPTVDEAQALTPESDFRRFAAPEVPADVKNAALKKLFADPRFNVMDGLDVYVDDYSRPDPIAPERLRRLAGAQFLGLFDRQPASDELTTGDDADNRNRESVANCSRATGALTEPCDANPDLRLQQDHAAPGEDPGRGSG